jgi:predicted RecA/RadA family phage recombinase
MKDKVLGKLGKKGLLLLAVLAVAGFILSPKVTLAAIGAVGMLGMATGTVQDTIQNIRTLVYTHNATLESGDVIVVNGRVLMAVNDSDADAPNVFVWQGKIQLPKSNALAINVGDAVYWSAAAGEVTKTGTDTPCGMCVEDAADTDTEVTIFLSPFAAA